MTRETEVGVLLHRFRTYAGLSQEVLAERSGLSSRGISDIERGLKARPHLHTLLQLADALDLSSADRDLLKLAARPVSVPGELESPESPASGGTPFSARAGESVRLVPHPEQDGRTERTNLGDQPTRFIGREREIDAISALLTQPERSEEHTSELQSR